MTLDTFGTLVCAIFVITYALAFKVNWQWKGFDKIRGWFKQKGGK